MDTTEKPSEPKAGPAVTVALLRPSFWTSGLIFFLGVTTMILADVVAITAELITTGASLQEVMAPASLLAAGVVVMGAVVVRRIVSTVRPVPPVSFFDDHLTLPTDLRALHARRVDYRDILSIATRGDIPRGYLVIESRQHLVVMPFAAFSDPEGPKVVIEELNARMRALPQSAEMAERAAKRQEIAEEAYSRRPWATQALVGVLVVMFLNQLLSSSFADTYGAIMWGGNSPALVKSGEYFRVIAASFLHAPDPVWGVIHLSFNLFALYLVGGLLERLLGWARFIIIYLSSGIAAMAASALLHVGQESVGASGAVFGILGGLAVVNWRYQTDLPLGFRQPLRLWVMILALNGALPVLLPLVSFARIDIAAHAAGFVFGGVVTAGLIEWHKRLQIGIPVPPLLYAATFGLIALNALAVGRAVLYAARFGPETRVAVARVIAADPAVDPNGLNQLAWGLVQDPGISAEGLALAREIAGRAVALAPGDTNIIDTLAAAEERAEAWDLAIEHERQALEQVGEPFVSTSAGRFFVRVFMAGREPLTAPGSPVFAARLGFILKARLDRLGPVLPEGVAMPSLSVVVPPSDVVATPAKMRLELAAAAPRGLTVYALAEQAGELKGLVRLSLAPTDGLQHEVAMTQDAADALALRRVEIKIALVAIGPLDKAPGTGVVLRYWPRNKLLDDLQ